METLPVDSAQEAVLVQIVKDAKGKNDQTTIFRHCDVPYRDGWAGSWLPDESNHYPKGKMYQPLEDN